MNPIETAHKLIAERQFDQLDDLWTDMILDGGQTIEDLLSLTTELKKLKETERALMLLEILASQFEQDKKYRQAIDVHKAMLYYHANENKARAKLIELYRRVYSSDMNLDEYIELSGLNTGEPIIKALDRLEEFLSFSVGRQFFFDKYGLGKVIEAVPKKREIIIDFEKANRYFLKIDVAKGLLIPIDKNHILAMKHTAPEELKAMIEKDPVALAKKIIRDWHQPLTAAKIKNLLDGVIDQNEIDDFWECVKKDLVKDPEIKTEGRSIKTYRYIADTKAETQAVLQQFEKARSRDKYKMAQDIARHTPELLPDIMPRLKTLGNSLHEKDPALAVHIYIFSRENGGIDGFNYSPESILRTIDPVQLLNNMHETEHQRIIVDIMKAKSGDQWAGDFKKLFLMIKDPALLDYIDDLLTRNGASDPSLYQQIITLPKNYPEQYKWLLKKMIGGRYREQLIPALVPRIIQSADFIKGSKLTVQKLLNLETFDQIIVSASNDDATRIYNALMTSPIDEHHKKGLIRIIEYHHTGMFKKPEEIVYTTESSLINRQAELKHLLDVEIPANKKDISRAREHGDLSENFEYKAAKEKQDQLYAKVRLIEDELKNFRLIKSENIDINQVSIGTKITLVSTDENNSVQYTILGRWDTDLGKNIIANEAPIAGQMIGKKIGDEVEINSSIFRISKIEKAL